MKRILFFIFLFMLTVGIVSAKQNKQKFIAKVKLLKGKVYIKTSAGQKKKLLKINQKIPVNSDIITLRNGKVTLFFRGGILVELKPNSHLLINKSFINKNNTSLSLIRGRSRFKIKKLLKNSGVQVYTPTAVVGVRGTEYEIQIADDGSLGVNVDDGKIKVDSDAGNKILNKNQNAEVDLENSNIKVNNEKKDLEKWDNSKKKSLKKHPDKKVSIIKTRFADTKKSQLSLLKNFNVSKNDKGKAEKSEEKFFKNIAETKGLYAAAKNIKAANKGNKKVGRLFKAIKRMHSALEKLNKIVEEKFNKLDEYYNKKSNALDEKFNKLNEDIDKQFNDKNGDF